MPITPTITADQIEELNTILKERLRTAVASALKKPSDLIGSAGEISTLVAGIDALQQAKEKHYLVEPSDRLAEKIDEFSKRGR